MSARAETCLARRERQRIIELQVHARRPPGERLQWRPMDPGVSSLLSERKQEAREEN